MKKKITPNDLKIKVSYDASHESMLSEEQNSPVNKENVTRLCGPDETGECTIITGLNCESDQLACYSKICPISDECPPVSSSAETCSSDCTDIPPETSDSCAF